MRRGGSRTQSQSRQRRRSTLLSQERGCVGALGGAVCNRRSDSERLLVVICLVVASVSTRLMASSKHRTLAVEVCFVKRRLAKLVRLNGACAIVDGTPLFNTIYL